MMKFDHIGIFVKDLNYGAIELSKLFEITEKSPIYHDSLIQVAVQFCYDRSGICYELVAPYGDNNPVDAVLNNNGTILNHIAYKTNKFDDMVLSLRDNGCLPLGKPKPAVAFSGSRVVFFLTPLRLIFELIEDDEIQK